MMTSTKIDVVHWRIHVKIWEVREGITSELSLLMPNVQSTGIKVDTCTIVTS